jgi:ubiquinone/menaquinone biosynthesis C-methylase UbiE
MNAFENWFCGSAIWRYATREKLLPWILQGSELGEHLLELGAGPGAATGELLRRVARVTSLEYSHRFAAQLQARYGANGLADGVSVVQGDAAALPFASETFSSVVAVLMLHHLRSKELQERAFAEISRVLRPGGVFLAFEIQDSWVHRVGHIRSTFVPVDPATIATRLEAIGFSRVSVESQRGGFWLRAVRERAA